jgi:hypothetical protein
VLDSSRERERDREAGNVSKKDRDSEKVLELEKVA